MSLTDTSLGNPCNTNNSQVDWLKKSSAKQPQTTLKFYIRFTKTVSTKFQINLYNEIKKCRRGWSATGNRSWYKMLLHTVTWSNNQGQQWVYIASVQLCTILLCLVHLTCYVCSHFKFFSFKQKNVSVHRMCTKKIEIEHIFFVKFWCFILFTVI